VNHGKLKKVAAALPEKVRTLANYELFELGRNAKLKMKDMLRAVFDAALNFTSIEVIADVNNGGPSADTIRGHLNWKVSIDDVENMMKADVKWLAALTRCLERRKTTKEGIFRAFQPSVLSTFGSTVQRSTFLNPSVEPTISTSSGQTEKKTPRQGAFQE